MIKQTHNVVSISGGKDSTAMALLAVERQTENLHFVFADTGHEHQITYQYIDYLDGVLRSKCGVGIAVVKANFDMQIAGKREFIEKKWAEHGVPQEKINKALGALVPTGSPFLDLCLWKGRFPSTRARFCSQELKHHPLDAYANDLEGTLISWQGVRADESLARKNLPMYDVDMGGWEPEPFGRLIYRPIINWTAAECFAQHKNHGVDHNPLYEQGMGRVGCMPCIHARKDELRNIALRFPAEVERVQEWERMVSDASKWGCSTMFHAQYTDGEEHLMHHTTHGISAMVEWSKTTRGGKQYDLIATAEDIDAPQCSSLYGLCE